MREVGVRSSGGGPGGDSFGWSLSLAGGEATPPAAVGASLTKPLVVSGSGRQPSLTREAYELSSREPSVI